MSSQLDHETCPAEEEVFTDVSLCLLSAPSVPLAQCQRAHLISLPTHPRWLKVRDVERTRHLSLPSSHGGGARFCHVTWPAIWRELLKRRTGCHPLSSIFISIPEKFLQPLRCFSFLRPLRQAQAGPEGFDLGKTALSIELAPTHGRALNTGGGSQ